MLAEIAAANAAFAVIKTAIQNGREIADVATSVGKYVNATEDLRKKGEKKKRKGNSDLEEFMHLEKLKQQEEQLKQWMIWAGRPNLWSDWQKFQAQARKARLQELEARRRKIKQWIDIAIISGATILLGTAFFFLIGWALYLKNL